MDYEINKELGECYLFMGDFTKAAEYYDKARQVDEAQADPYLGLATVAVQLGNLDDAVSMYAKAAELAPSDKAFTGLALVEMEQGLHQEAFAHFRAGLGENPGNMFAINGLVQEGYFLNRLEEVLPHLENAVALHDMESLRYTLAGCLTALGRDAEARKHLEILLDMNPENESAQELYARFAA
jgi:tetratricopeptide (TPR) repeat protein